jgi:hypothetical protein
MKQRERLLCRLLSSLRGKNSQQSPEKALSVFGGTVETKRLRHWIHCWRRLGYDRVSRCIGPADQLEKKTSWLQARRGSPGKTFRWGVVPRRSSIIDKDADLALLSVCATSKEAKRPKFQLDPARDEQIILIANRTRTSSCEGNLFRALRISGPPILVDQSRCVRRLSGSPVYNHQGDVVGVFCGYDSTEGARVHQPRR